MRFGTITTHVTTADGIQQVTEQRNVNWTTVYEQTTFKESVKVKNQEQVMAHFLKLLDEQKSGKKHDVGLQVFTDKDGNIDRIEKTWCN